MNAKHELFKVLADTTANIKCARIELGTDLWGEEPKQIILKLGYTFNEWESFLRQLNVEYDNGYGGQQLYGTVWLDDNTWLSRGEYDGSEWWIHNRLPSIPDVCRDASKRKLITKKASK